MKLFLAFLIAVVYAKNEEYTGWKSYSVGPSNQDQLFAIGSLIRKLDLDFLSKPTVGREGITLVKPQHQEEFTKILKDLGIPYRIHVEDVKAELDQEDHIMKARKAKSRATAGAMNYENYQEIDVIDAYLESVAKRHPNLVTLVKPATSFEGHPIRYLKISTTNFEDHNKPIIFIDGGIHAREWISPPTVTWAIHKLVENVTEPDLLENFDWILLPVVNPDGYKHTFTARFWRKTRSNDTNELSRQCPGVDGNRNYDVYWNYVGTSDYPCSDIYAGNKAFSEVETRVVRDIMHEHLDQIALYLTMHSYGSMILYPWGHEAIPSDNAEALQEVGDAMGNAIDSISLSHFPRYTVGNSVLVIGYAASGAAEDYAHSIGVPLAYTIELPGLSPSLGGFHLDPIYIQQVVIETWKGISAGARKAGDLFVKK